VISKFKNDGSAISSETIDLKLSLLAQTTSGQFIATSAEIDGVYGVSVGTVSVDAISTSFADSGGSQLPQSVTLVHDFTVDTSSVSSSAIGYWFKIERISVSGNYTYDGLAAGSTKEEAFQIVNVLFSEKDLSHTSSKSEIFESSANFFRLPELAASQSSVYTRYPLTTLGSPEFLSTNFVLAGSQQIIVPIHVDERHNDRESIEVSVFGYVKEAAKGVTLKLSAVSGYAATDLSEPSEIASSTVTSDATFSGSNDSQFMEHTFNILRTNILSGGGIHQDNESAPNDERRTTLYLKIERTDTAGPTNYYGVCLRAQSAAAKLVTGADPHIDISENPSHPLIVGGSFRHDKLRDILLSSHRHNWSFGILDWSHILWHDNPGLPPGGVMVLMPSNFTIAPAIAYGQHMTLNMEGSASAIPGQSGFKKTGLQTVEGLHDNPVTHGQSGLNVLGTEWIGKHIPFSMAITAVHGWVVEPDVFVPNIDGTQDSNIPTAEYTNQFDITKTTSYTKGVPLLDTQIKIVFRVVEIPGSSAITLANKGETAETDNMAYAATQSEITSDKHSGVINFPFEVYPGNATRGRGVIRWLGTDLTTNATSSVNRGPIPQVYLPSDYSDIREYMLVAELHNITRGEQAAGDQSYHSVGQQLFPIIDLNVEVAFLPNPNVNLMHE